MRMRRSTRKTGALILDLVTLTPAGVPLPPYYTRLRTHAVAGAHAALRRPEAPTRISAAHIRRARHDRAQAASRTDAKCAARSYAHDTHDVRKRPQNDLANTSSPYVHLRIIHCSETGSSHFMRNFHRERGKERPRRVSLDFSSLNCIWIK